jgi:two-component system, LytTR family, response regulator
MISAIIVEDEQHCTDRLIELLEHHHRSTIHLIMACDSVEAGIAAVQLHQPSLLFLDVQIGEQTGFDLLSAIKREGLEVIFTTAYERFAVQAFKFSALDYLLKPVAAEDLATAIDKVVQKTVQQHTVDKLDSLLHNIRQMQGGSRKICVPEGNGIRFLDTADIIRCESDVNYTIFHLKDHKKLVVAKTLKDFEELLADHLFFRVHNSHLINLNYIKSYNKGKGGFVVMADQSQVEVSTRRKDDFLKAIQTVF